MILSLETISVIDELCGLQATRALVRPTVSGNNKCKSKFTNFAAVFIHFLMIDYYDGPSGLMFNLC